MRKVTVACTQMMCSRDREENIKKAEELIREAAGKGADIIQVQELFETPYFAQIEDYDYIDLARPRDNNPMLDKMCKIARELKVVLPVSFYEDAGIVRFNTVAVMQMGKFLVSTEKLIFRMIWGIMKNFISVRAIQVLKFGIHIMQKSVLAYAGISGSLRRRE